MPPSRVSASCAVCGTDRAEPLFAAPDPDGHDAEPFLLVGCPECGLVYVSPRPPTSDLSRFYSRGYYDKPGEDSGRFGRMFAGLFMAERVSRIDGFRPRGRLLDIGCGEGTFLAAMTRRGWECSGVEVSEEGARRTASRVGVVVHAKALEECGLPGDCFDVITLWHSIEHVQDPAALLREAARLLKDGGRIFVAFPNARSWDIRLFGARWFHLDAPRHLNFFSPETMTRLLSEAGLRVESVGQYSVEYNLFGFVQSALNLMTSNMNYLYRSMKGTIVPGAQGSAADAAVTILAFPVLLLCSLPYSIAAALTGHSGCIDVVAQKG